MTTALACFMDGRPLAAFQAHPGGFGLAAAIVTAALAALDVVVTGRGWRVNWYRVSPSWVPLTIALLVIGGWVYKIISGLLTGALPLPAPGPG
jgi:hypothetical protein